MRGAPIFVAFADHASELGGAEVSLAVLWKYLRQAGLDCSLFCSHSAEWPEQLGIDDERLIPAFPPSPALEIRRSELNRLWSLIRSGAALAPVVARIRSELRRRRFDLVHGNTLKANVLAGIAARLARVPVVWHMRDIVLEAGARVVLRAAARFCRPTVIAISNAVAACARQITNNVVVIYNGVELDRFSPGPPPGHLREELQIGPHEPVITIVARLTFWKGHRPLLRAMPRVLERFPAAKLLVVGAPAFWHDDFAEELRALAQSLGISHAVRFLGHRTDIPEILRLTDVFALPSQNEPFGRAIVEAMAVGVPVVAGRGGGVPEVCPDGVCGLLVDPDDSPEIADAIIQILSNPELARRLGEAGRRRAMELFDARAVARQVADLYQTVLTKRRR